MLLHIFCEEYGNMFWLLYGAEDGMTDIYQIWEEESSS